MMYVSKYPKHEMMIMYLFMLSCLPCLPCLPRQQQQGCFKTYIDNIDTFHVIIHAYILQGIVWTIILTVTVHMQHIVCMQSTPNNGTEFIVTMYTCQQLPHTRLFCGSYFAPLSSYLLDVVFGDLWYVSSRCYGRAIAIKQPLYNSVYVILQVLIKPWHCLLHSLHITDQIQCYYIWTWD